MGYLLFLFFISYILLINSYLIHRFQEQDKQAAIALYSKTKMNKHNLHAIHKLIQVIRLLGFYSKILLSMG